jgi:hypothetical protein
VDDAAQGIFEILCPGRRAVDVKAVLGSEGMIFMAGPSRTQGDDKRALIFINFDSTFGFEVMKGLDGSLAHARQTQQDDVFKEDGRVK